ncbi:MAG: ribonuclease HII, partial [Dehalococcoidia bacterium]|nr:ribonuclease HII [Dehalococcoidia bacterium]
MSHIPTLAEESRLNGQGYHLIAGIDEVGRGPLAGPVMAGAVILHKDARYPWLDQVRDSKELATKAREQLFDRIARDSVSWGVGVCTSEVIDDQGIARATHLAMRQAVSRLKPPPDFLLIDAVRLLEVNIPLRSFIKGDRLCASIAAASIMAKVSRDRLMCELDGEFPGYGFAQHKGYGTAEHLDSLRRLGPCPIHRRSFSPVKDMVSGL